MMLIVSVACSRVSLGVSWGEPFRLIAVLQTVFSSGTVTKIMQYHMEYHKSHTQMNDIQSDLTVISTGECMQLA